jgi:hypothetical protein
MLVLRYGADQPCDKNTGTQEEAKRESFPSIQTARPWTAHSDEEQGRDRRNGQYQRHPLHADPQTGSDAEFLVAPAQSAETAEVVEQHRDGDQQSSAQQCPQRGIEWSRAADRKRLKNSAQSQQDIEFIRQSHFAEVDDRERSKNAGESDAAERLQGQNVERYLHAKTLKPEKSRANDNCVCLSMRSNKDDRPPKRFATANRKAVDKFLKVGRMTRCDDELSDG